MSKHTSFQIGGPVDILILPQTIEEIKWIQSLSEQMEFELYIMGNGSNILVADGGIKGVVVKISENFSDINIEKNVVKACAGVLLSKLSNQVAEKALAGFEFASGIPGTLGGAVFMNAGAYGGEMKHVVKEVTFLNESGEIHTLSGEQMAFGYRQSAIEGTKNIILEATLHLEYGDKKDIQLLMDELSSKRREKQPLTLPSAGSTFKRPKGYYAGKLIDDSGLRGLSYGGAQISEKHCGFVVNKGGATSSDVHGLIQTAQKIVHDQFGVKLEPEVRFWGKDKNQ